MSAPHPSEGIRGTFGNDFITAANQALNLYPNTEITDIEDECIIYEIYYNDIFEKIRHRMAEDAQSLQQYFNVSGGIVGKIPGLIQRIVDFEATMDEDDFVNTHWLDVFFYLGIEGEAVRVKVATEIAKIIAKHGTQHLHFVAHSLGTAVLHDTLHKMYNEEFSDRALTLPVGTAKIRSVWQLANVSRLTNLASKVADPYRSRLRPGPKEGGACLYMASVDHKWDPIPNVRRFSPPQDWVSPRARKQYKEIRPDHIRAANTHDFAHYVADPEFNRWFFRLVLNAKIPYADYKKAVKAHRASSLQGAADKVTATYRNIGEEDGSFEAFFIALKQLNEVVLSLNGSG